MGVVSCGGLVRGGERWMACWTSAVHCERENVVMKL